MKHKTTTIVIATVAILGAAAFSFVNAQAPAATPAPAPAPAPVTFESLLSFLPDTVAEVGSKKITKQDFISLLSQQAPAEAFAQIPQEQLKPFLKNAVDSLVEREVIVQVITKAGYKPSPEAVIKKFDEMMKTATPEEKEQFESLLKQRGKTLDSYKTEMAKDPMTQEQIAIQTWVEESLKKDIQDVTDAEIEKFYRENPDFFKTAETVSASHILIKVETDKDGKKLSDEEITKNDEAALKKAQSILAQLKQGAKFETLAEKESDCPSGKSIKGSLGKFEKGRMVPEFENVAFSLEKKGQISEIVKTPFGYHIIRLDEEKTPAGVQPLADVKEDIKGHLTQRKFEDAMKAVTAKEKESMTIKINGFDDLNPAPAAK